MTQRNPFKFTAGFLLCGLLILTAPVSVAAEPTPAAVSAFNSYIGTVESRLAEQHRSQKGLIVVLAAQSEVRLRRGELIVEQITPSTATNLPGATIYHWRGT